MLRIKTTVKPSATHGLGLFTDQHIPKGTVTWSYDLRFDTGFTEEDLASLPILARNFLLYYTYFDKDLGKYILCCDNQRYINHTANKEQENILSTPQQDVAIRDIMPGEELLCDYRKFDDNYFTRIGLTDEELV